MSKPADSPIRALPLPDKAYFDAEALKDYGRVTRTVLDFLKAMHELETVRGEVMAPAADAFGDSQTSALAVASGPDQHQAIGRILREAAEVSKDVVAVCATPQRFIDTVSNRLAIAEPLSDRYAFPKADALLTILSDSTRQEITAKGQYGGVRICLTDAAEKFDHLAGTLHAVRMTDPVFAAEEAARHPVGRLSAILQLPGKAIGLLRKAIGRGDEAEGRREPLLELPLPNDVQERSHKLLR